MRSTPPDTSPDREPAPRRVPTPDELAEVGRWAGLDAVGVCTAHPFGDARAALEERKAAGLHGGMWFTYGRPEVSTDPGRALEGARCIVVGARRHPVAIDDGPVGRPAGRVARYATADHYGPLREALERVADHLRSAGWRARVCCDDNAMVDRAAAVRAGLGAYGRNANVLIRGRGSWFLLGGVVTDAPVVDTDPAPVPDPCGSCRRCIDGCPTGAIVAPGVVDARRCLAWLVQAPGVFPREHRRALGDRLYGCDDCQEVCPWNHPRRTGGAPDPAPPGTVDVADLLAASDEELLDRHGRWYIPRRQPRHLRRNAYVILGNTADPSDPLTGRLLTRGLSDPDPLVAAHAVWACRALGRTDLVAAAIGAGALDVTDPLVAAELDAPDP